MLLLLLPRRPNRREDRASSSENAFGRCNVLFAYEATSEYQLAAWSTSVYRVMYSLKWYSV